MRTGSTEQQKADGGVITIRFTSLKVCGEEIDEMNESESGLEEEAAFQKALDSVLEKYY